MTSLKMIEDKFCRCGKSIPKISNVCWDCSCELSGIKEDEIVKIIDSVINQIMREITPFAIYRGAELRQQCYLFGIEAMTTGKFDNTKLLGPFLRKCIVNRVISLSRDRYSRNEPPCNKCMFADKEFKKTISGCNAFNDKMKCDKFKGFYDRNKAKRDIMNLKSKIPLFEDTIGSDYKPFVDVDNKDYIEYISKFLTNASKHTLKNLVEHKTVSKKRLDKLREEVGYVLKYTAG